MADRKIIHFLLMPAIIAGIVALAGCSQGEEIEIFLPPNTNPQLAGQIYIGGSVSNPGYYPLKESDSIQDLIRAAGGLTDGADLNQIELLIPQPANSC